MLALLTATELSCVPGPSEPGITYIIASRGRLMIHLLGDKLCRLPRRSEERPDMKGLKLISADAAARLIQDNDAVATSGFVGVGVPEELALALEKRFLASGSPRNLTPICAAGNGDGQTKGLNRLVREGQIKETIGGHWGRVPSLSALASRTRSLLTAY